MEEKNEKLIFFLNDKSGKKKKLGYVKKYHKEIYDKICEWSNLNKFNELGFCEKAYLYAYDITCVPKCNKTNKKLKFVSFSRGYSVGVIDGVNNVFKNLSDLKEKIDKQMLEKQKKGGYISQIILNDDNLLDELNKINNFNVSFRAKVYMFLNDLNDIPVCPICNESKVKFGNNRGFLKTCSNHCRREMEMRSGYKTKTYKTISGNILNVQGYENFVLDDLFLKYNENDVVVGNKNIAKHIGDIFYKDNNGVVKQYFPDIYIKSENKVIEVKSSYTFEVDKEINLKKRDAVLKKGFLFEFNVWDLKKII